jgi:hypothetical protein
MRKLIVLALVVLLGSFFVPAAGLTHQAKCKVVNQTSGGRFDNLQAAVDDAMTGDTLRVKGTCHGTTTILGGINLTIKGKSNPGLGEATLDGDNAGSVLTVSAAIVEIDGLRITNGNASVGGGIYNDSGVVTLTDSTVSGNTASDGGGIFNVSGEFFGVVELTNSTVSDNFASEGGGIYNDGGTVTLTNSTVSDNIPNDCIGC